MLSTNMVKTNGPPKMVKKIVPLGHRGAEIVPLRVPYYEQSNSASTRGTVLVLLFLSVRSITIVVKC